MRQCWGCKSQVTLKYRDDMTKVLCGPCYDEFRDKCHCHSHNGMRRRHPVHSEIEPERRVLPGQQLDMFP